LCFADLARSNVCSVARRRNWSVCSGRVDTDLTQLTRSWNVCIPRHWCTSYHSVQLPELLTFWWTLRHSVSEDPTRIELLHQKDVSSVSLIAAELHFPPTSLSSATQLAPKRFLAPFLSFFLRANNVSSANVGCDRSILQNLCALDYCMSVECCLRRRLFDSTATADNSHGILGTLLTRMMNSMVRAITVGRSGLWLWSRSTIPSGAVKPLGYLRNGRPTPCMIRPYTAVVVSQRLKKMDCFFSLSLSSFLIVTLLFLYRVLSTPVKPVHVSMHPLRIDWLSLSHYYVARHEKRLSDRPRVWAVRRRSLVAYGSNNSQSISTNRPRCTVVWAAIAKIAFVRLTIRWRLPLFYLILSLPSTDCGA